MNEELKKLIEQQTAESVKQKLNKDKLKTRTKANIICAIFSVIVIVVGIIMVVCVDDILGCCLMTAGLTYFLTNALPNLLKSIIAYKNHGMVENVFGLLENIGFLENENKDEDSKDEN